MSQQRPLALTFPLHGSRLIEASAAQVSRGVQLVTETGSSLDGIVGSVSDHQIEGHTGPTAVVALNRAAALGQAQGPAAGLQAMDALDADALTEYQPYHATRADLLARAARPADAADAYDRAIDLSHNPTERQFLEQQRALLDGPSV